VNSVERKKLERKAKTEYVRGYQRGYANGFARRWTKDDTEIIGKDEYCVNDYDLTQPLELELALKTDTGPNARLHYMARSRRVKQQRATVAMFVRAAVKFPPENIHALLVLICPNEVDSDNVQGRLKAVRDGVAQALGINDRSKRFTWEYAQERCTRGRFGVRIRLERLNSAAEGV
jgi:hypothetical protein